MTTIGAQVLYRVHTRHRGSFARIVRCGWIGENDLTRKRRNYGGARPARGRHGTNTTLDRQARDRQLDARRLIVVGCVRNRDLRLVPAAIPRRVGRKRSDSGAARVLVPVGCNNSHRAIASVYRRNIAGQYYSTLVRCRTRARAVQRHSLKLRRVRINDYNLLVCRCLVATAIRGGEGHQHVASSTSRPAVRRVRPGDAHHTAAVVGCARFCRYCSYVTPLTSKGVAL